jgi:phage anti-repressor protein
MSMPTKYQNNPFNTAIEVFHDSRSGHDREYCDARELHEALQVETRFDTWFSRRVKEYGFIDGTDFCSNLSRSPVGRPSSEYQLTIGMAKELAMVERTDVGRRVRQYFIFVEEHTRKLLEEQASQVQPIEQVTKRIKDNGKFTYLIILQEQGHKIASALGKASDPEARYQLHCQLRQVNDALGIPTPPLNPKALPEQ